MDPHSFIARAEAQRWIGIAEKLLMGHDFVGSKTFAIRARESDPRLEAADQILAIVDTFLAAERRVVGNDGVQQPDFYAILQLGRFVQDIDRIAVQYRRLAVLLNPNQNRFPYSDQAFQLVNDAWAVLSNPMRKSMYDSELDFTPQQQMNSLGFNLEQQHHHHQHHQQQQHQHNFFYRELSEPPQTFQARAQQSHQPQQLYQHNFLSQPNPVRQQQEELFQQREQEQLFQLQVQPFQITSSPQRQTRPQPQLPMQSPSPPSPAAPPQPPLSWSQALPLSQPPIQPLSPPAPAAPQPPFCWPQAPPPSQPQQQPSMQPPPPPAPSPPQPPFSWPQAPPSRPQPRVEPEPQPQPQPLVEPNPQPQPHVGSKPQLQPREQLQQKQGQQQLEQEQLQQSLEQDDPGQLPTQVNGNNMKMETETESDATVENVNESPTFWTPCPYCFYMYEYPRVYADHTLRCDNCERAFQAVPVPSPPAIVEGQEAYFTCSGFFPLAVSASHLHKYNGTRTNSNWTPFSPFNDAASSNPPDHSNGGAAPVPKKNSFVNRTQELPIYIDDVTDDLFMGISEPSDDSDDDWNSSSTKKKNMKRMKKSPVYQKKSLAQATKKGASKNMQDGIPMQESEEAPTIPVAENSKKVMGSNPRRQSARVKKDLGKLDLNVEFNNTEGEEPAPGTSSGNRGHGHGEEDNIEGIEFFEGLDEYLNSLPILSVVNDVKVKAA